MTRCNTTQECGSLHESTFSISILYFVLGSKVKLLIFLHSVSIYNRTAGGSSAPAITLVLCAVVVGSGWLGSGTPPVTLPLMPMRSCTTAGPPPWPPCSVCELKRPGYKTREPRRGRTPRRRRNVTAPQRRTSDLRCPRSGERPHSCPRPVVPAMSSSSVRQTPGKLSLLLPFAAQVFACWAAFSSLANLLASFSCAFLLLFASLSSVFLALFQLGTRPASRAFSTAPAPVASQVPL